MEITSKPEALDEMDRKVLQLEMERLSLQKVRRCSWKFQSFWVSVCLCQTGVEQNEMDRKVLQLEMERLSL
jgi:predicted phosphohydrolase